MHSQSHGIFREAEAGAWALLGASVPGSLRNDKFQAKCSASDHQPASPTVSVTGANAAAFPPQLPRLSTTIAADLERKLAQGHDGFDILIATSKDSRCMDNFVIPVW